MISLPLINLREVKYDMVRFRPFSSLKPSLWEIIWNCLLYYSTSDTDKKNIVKPDDYSEWAILVVNVSKQNITVRIWGHYTETVNAYNENVDHSLSRNIC